MSTPTHPSPNYTVIPDVCQPSTLLLAIFWGQLGVLLLALGAGLPLAWKTLGLMACYGIWLTLLILLCWCMAMRGWQLLLHRAKTDAQVALLSNPSLVLLALWLLAMLIAAFGAWLVATLGGNPILALVPAGLSKLAFIGQTILCCTVMCGVLLRYLHLQQRWQAQMALNVRAELQQLQSRLRPHFLYNSLNTVVALIDEQPDDAITAIEDLSDLLRQSLQPHTKLVALAQEIDVCEKYLALLQWRLGERMQVSWQVDDGIIEQAWQIPPMALQTLLENAVVHGIQQCTTTSTLEININAPSKKLKITVRNPFPAPNESTVDRSEHTRKIILKTGTGKTGTGTALLDLTKRLHLLFGDHADLLTFVDNQHFVAQLKLPMPSISERLS